VEPIPSVQGYNNVWMVYRYYNWYNIATDCNSN